MSTLLSTRAEGTKFPNLIDRWVAQIVGKSVTRQRRTSRVCQDNAPLLCTLSQNSQGRRECRIPRCYEHTVWNKCYQTIETHWWNWFGERSPGWPTGLSCAAQEDDCLQKDASKRRVYLSRGNHVEVGGVLRAKYRICSAILNTPCMSRGCEWVPSNNGILELKRETELVQLALSL